MAAPGTKQVSEEDTDVQKIKVIDVKYRQVSIKKRDRGHQYLSRSSTTPNSSTTNYSTTQLFNSILNQFEGTSELEDDLVKVESNPTPDLMHKWIEKLVKKVSPDYNKEDTASVDRLHAFRSYSSFAYAPTMRPKYALTDSASDSASPCSLPEAFILEDGLVKVDPKPKPGPESEVFDNMVKEAVLIYFDTEDPVTLELIDGNYAPIRQETPSCDVSVVEGLLPSNFNGMYFRVGPDSIYNPEANYKPMDGDGMIHAVQIKDGEAKYTSHYVKNSRFIQEKAFGKATMLKYGDLRGPYGFFVTSIQKMREKKVLDMSYGYTTSNVGLVYHAGRLMALEDFGKPYVIYVGEDGNMETVGMNTYHDKLDHNFTPHPKKDPVTGEMVAIALSHEEPYAYHTVVNSEGVITSDVHLTVSGPTYMHDFAITEKYSIIMDNPYFYNLQNMMAMKKWIFQFDNNKKSRYGILPRNALDDSDIKWFELNNPSFIFHTVNAWEEGETIVMYGCNMEATYNERTKDFDIYPIAFQNFGTKYDDEAQVTLTRAELYKFTFNMTTGLSTKDKVAVVDDVKLESPKINETYMGRKTQYLYANTIDDIGKTFGIYKHDLDTGKGIVKIIHIGEEEAFLSEHSFAPKENPTSEDDGYVVLFAHIETTSKAYFVVLDAKDLSMVASVDLKARIPYGFHSIFVSQEELKEQVKTSLSET